MYSSSMNFAVRKYISGYAEYLDVLRKYGFLGILEEVRVRKSLWHLKSIKTLESSDQTVSTSITDRPSYLEICRVAATNDMVLSNFKRCYEYRLVLEHVSRSQGQKYLDLLENNSAVMQNLLDLAPKEIGNPVVYEYPKIGKISPTQLRYAKIVQDLETIFPSANLDVIVEVGIGNGGQAWQISQYFKPRKYFLVDLPEVLSLTIKTGAPYNFDTQLHFVAPSDVIEIESDLFISNYAFSELKKSAQDLYLRAYVLRAKAGYMLYNHIHENQNESYTVQEIQAMIPNSKIMDETPITYTGNYLLVWG
jgi:hypothetical protein